ncbi:hypothetical protein Hypma_015380 [Hypsizygus marmoreus]|uniref:Uncharacterized protein n=1 Tax=Hypsizygus marmoreus TaxID=39966 RepID=A0A369K8A4_HYPMA|nr:hypothetical protein Hypma_015380 [Hypsizygus marmoreus]
MLTDLNHLMVNPGNFKGSRKAFLVEQKPLYAAAVAGNHVADTVADILRRYFKRYPATLPLTEEPSPEFLAQVDDSAADVEPPVLDEALMTEGEFEAAMKSYNEYKALYATRRAPVSGSVIHHVPVMRTTRSLHQPL